VDDAAVQVGMPEVSLGVIPGAGGTQRLPRMIGIQNALEHIVQGKIVRAPKAVKVGLIDELAADRDAVMDAAARWIADNPGAMQPWDKNEPIPGPQSGSEDARNMFMVACAMTSKKTAGVYPAAEYAISALQEGLGLTFDRALDVEARYFTKLATSDQAKDMIRTLWFHRRAAEKHEGQPSTDEIGITRVGILGAGMMGAGLAVVCAQSGFDVVLKDIKQDALDKGMAHCEKSVAKIAKHLDEVGRKKLLGRIRSTLALEDLEGCDLVIEAVFEDLSLKHRVTKETEPKLAADGIWASNTSAIPITDLAEASARPERFIGMHFFSPVEQMQLLEIIVGEKTSDETLARSLAFCAAIKKLPIVVNDGYAFYTTRVFSAYILEGAQLIAEGHDPVLVEWAARQAGMVVPPLQVFDEITLSLAVHAFKEGRKYGRQLSGPGTALVEKLATELGRTGRTAGEGFYDYGPDGRRRGLWPGLAELCADEPEDTGVDLVARRLLAIQAVEAARAVEEGIVREHRDAEVGAIFGVGYAPNTGGPLSYIDRRGVGEFVAELQGFAERCGDRYAPPKLLLDMARANERFFEAV
jgi:3-hydroxyacyl-CoA dehydrogenase/enoyl-CoA hydratase/3-hydroxybutyryl-CoA epimerase